MATRYPATAAEATDLFSGLPESPSLILSWLPARAVSRARRVSLKWLDAADASLDAMHAAAAGPDGRRAVAVGGLVSEGDDEYDDDDLGNIRPGLEIGGGCLRNNCTAGTIDGALRLLMADLGWLPPVVVVFFGTNRSWGEGKRPDPRNYYDEEEIAQDTSSYETCCSMMPPGTIVVGCGADAVIGPDKDGCQKELYPAHLIEDADCEENGDFTVRLR